MEFEEPLGLIFGNWILISSHFPNSLRIDPSNEKLSGVEGNYMFEHERPSLQILFSCPRVEDSRGLRNTMSRFKEMLNCILWANALDLTHSFWIPEQIRTEFRRTKKSNPTLTLRDWSGISWLNEAIGIFEEGFGILGDIRADTGINLNGRQESGIEPTS